MLKAVKTRNLLSAMRKLGFREVRQKGSHLFMEHPDGRTTVIPIHDEIKVSLLTKIIKEDLKMGKEAFEKLL